MRILFNYILAVLFMLNIASCGKKGGEENVGGLPPAQVGQDQNNCDIKISGKETLSQFMIIGMLAADCGIGEEQVLGLTP